MKIWKRNNLRQAYYVYRNDLFFLYASHVLTAGPATDIKVKRKGA